MDLLARSAAVEDAWLLTGETWTDVGFQEEARNVRIDVTSAADAAGREPEDHAVFYHIHLFQRDPNSIDPPSLQDLDSLAALKGVCGVPTSGVIFDGRGKWSYDFKPDLARQLISDQCNEGISEGWMYYAQKYGYLQPRDSAARFRADYTMLVWNMILGNKQSRSQRIKSFLETAAQLGVSITYSLPR